MARATTSKEVKNPVAETKSTDDSKTVGEFKADGKTKAPDSTTTSKDLKTPTAESRPSALDSKTTRNAATTATAAAPAEKRTQIISAMKQEKVEEVTNVNFNVSIGTAVPAGVRYHPLPTRIVEIYPEWRGYDFILVHGRYVILRPHTHEIVYIIEG
jgi:enoyl reductase-like protein